MLGNFVFSRCSPFFLLDRLGLAGESSFGPRPALLPQVDLEAKDLISVRQLLQVDDRFTPGAFLERRLESGVHRARTLCDWATGQRLHTF